MSFNVEINLDQEVEIVRESLINSWRENLYDEEFTNAVKVVLKYYTNNEEYMETVKYFDNFVERN